MKNSYIAQQKDNISGTLIIITYTFINKFELINL